MSEPTTFGPFCARLASKKLCFRTAPPRTEDDVLDGSGRVWCAETMQVLGPDGGLVDPTLCRHGRACFEPYGPAARGILRA